MRQPRAHQVWENSKRAGDIWDSRAGYYGIRVEEVRSLWGYVWHRPVDADLHASEEILVTQGVFERLQ